MGEDKIQFRQSCDDFPLMVNLGSEVPAWGLSRWASPGLCFLPPDDEGFTLRGDKRRLLYKGRKRSHRFTILGDNAFEYDCILNREPESNVISLLIEGAKYFNFFRQPDLLKNPLLAGSYAVYKKETFIGEGTGKLCHIHRPEIIDSRGRRVWGDLSVAGNRLNIHIPEWWLSGAAYPVIVDPLIGTSTIGKRNMINNKETGYSEYLIITNGIAVNRFVTTDAVSGLCTAKVYVQDPTKWQSFRPVIYGENNNYPSVRFSKNETCHSTSTPWYTWRETTFEIDGMITSETPFWFGIQSDQCNPVFDIGGKHYVGYPAGFNMNALPGTFPNDYWKYSSEMKMSFYFEFSSSQSYVRTLTQGIKLADNPGKTGLYKRTLLNTGTGGTVIKRVSAYQRKHVMTLKITEMRQRIRGLYLRAVDTIKLSDKITYWRSLLRQAAQTCKTYMEGIRKIGNSRVINQNAQSKDKTSWGRGFFRAVVMNARTIESVIKKQGFLRKTIFNTAFYDKAGKSGSYTRLTMQKETTTAGTKNRAEYRRVNLDTGNYHGPALRHLIIVVKVFTVSLFRDYFLWRFLKSKEEIAIKSAVSREIIIESRIH